MKRIEIDKNILLKEVSLEDVNIIFNMIDSQRDYLREFLNFIDDTQTSDYTREYVREMMKRSADGGDIVFCIYYQNAFAGLIGFKGTDYVHSKTEIGYWVGQQFQGKGIISKSCKALVDYAFNEMKINRIQLRIVEANAKSAKVGERLGFKYEGTERDGEKLVSGFANVMVFSLLRKEYD